MVLVAALEDPCCGVDMALDDMPAHAVGGAQRPLQVDRTADGKLTQSGPLECLGHEIGGEGVVVGLGDGQAAPVDADGVARSSPLHGSRGVDRQPCRRPCALQALHAPELLNDSGEHDDPPVPAR